jgi:hypothetical protein
MTFASGQRRALRRGEGLGRRGGAGRRVQGPFEAGADHLVVNVVTAAPED